VVVDAEHDWYFWKDQDYWPTRRARIPAAEHQCKVTVVCAVPACSSSVQDPIDGYDSFQFDGTFANGTKIDDGQYRALLRVLKVGGNPNKEEDFESWLGPQFGVLTPP
jgi:hypothetical protein